MKDIIDRILEGEFHHDAGVLDFSCTKIDIELLAGEDYEGSFTIYGPPGRPTEGYVYADSLEMECITAEFSGASAGIAFYFHACNTREGEVRQGEFTILSNHGEYTLPYQVTVVAEEISSSMGTVKNLFHFTNLARANWEEAVSLFYSADFARLMSNTDRQYLPLYRGLSGGGPSSGHDKNQQNVEEFLLAVKKKQKLEYLITETEINLDAPGQPAEYTISINRNGWGYTWLKTEAEGDFIELHKEMLREEDFLGNFCRLPYYILPERLHAGHNFGRIRLANTDTEIIIPVTVTNRATGKKKGRRREQKHLILDLMRYYTAFRTRQINAAVWRKETNLLVDRLITLDEGDLAAKLFRAQLLLTEKRYNEAGWMLNHAGSRLAGREQEEPALWCYYKYLTTLHNGENDYIDEVAGEVEQLLLRNRGNWRIAWLLSYLRVDYSRNPAKKWRILAEQFAAGCTSPVIYVEALHLLQLNPTLLAKLEKFEIQVLLSAARQKCIPPGLIGQILYLSGKSKEYSELLFAILRVCYQVTPSVETVKAICGLLIKGTRTGEEYLPWYRLGIEHEIKVTRLFEYYFLSLNLEKEEKLPKIVLLYFVYHNDMDYRYQAYLYAYVHKYREEYPELYESYRETAERFVVKQMGQGRMNKWLAYLYKNYVTPEMITAETAPGLVKALFTVRVNVFRKDIREVVVIYDKGKKEQVYPFSSGQLTDAVKTAGALSIPKGNPASGQPSGFIINTISTGAADSSAAVSAGVIWLPLYSGGSHLFLADGAGNRYAGEGNYQVEKFLWPDKLGRLAAPFMKDSIGFDLWLCEKGEELAPVNAHKEGAMLRLLADECLTEGWQAELRMNLIRYFYEQDDIARLDRMLSELAPEQVDRRHDPEILKLMVRRYMYSAAYEWLKAAGSAGADAKVIMRILNGLIDGERVVADRQMTVLAHLAFSRGKYDETLLNYLNRFYQGPVRRMRDIWKAARDFGVDTYELGERLLIQMLYSDSFIGERMEIFREYVAGGGRNDVIMAVIVRCADDYFLADKVIDAFVIRQIEKAIDRQEELNQVCQLAYVKYFAENKAEIDQTVTVILEGLLSRFLDRNIYFAFFKEYLGLLPMMELFLDKTIIEYRARPGNKAVIHYLFERDQEEKSEYTREEMRDMYGGICVKQFVLFFGDRLLYYIAEEEDGKEYFTESARIGKGDVGGDLRECKYGQINDIEIARTLQDYETVDSLLYDFYRQEFVVGELFHLEKDVQGE